MKVCTETLGFADGIKAVIHLTVAQQGQINEAVKIKKFGVNTSIAMYLMNFMSGCSLNYSIQKLTAMLNDYNSRIAQESDSDIKRIEEALAENQRKISNIFSFIMENGFASDTAKETLTALEEEKKLLENQLKEITDKNTSNAISEAIVKELMEKSGEFLRTHKLSECRNFITSYVDKVIIYENKYRGDIQNQCDR